MTDEPKHPDELFQKNEDTLWADLGEFTLPEESSPLPQEPVPNPEPEIQFSDADFLSTQSEEKALEPSAEPPLTTEDSPMDLREQREESSLTLPPEPKQFTTIEQVKNFSETLYPSETPLVLETYRFEIRGPMTETERSRLLAFLREEKLELGDLDLELQFQAQHVRVTRLSEIQCILLAQRLRPLHAVLRVSRESDQDMPWNREESPYTREGIEAILPPSREIPIFPEGIQPDRAYYVLDTLVLGATLKSERVEALHSARYQALLDQLQNEMKHRAIARKADAIVALRVSLIPLESALLFKLHLQGSLIRWQ
jgi:hypothetical protein